ncbi:MAG: DUF4011 domain-containing protein [Bowdeniella nasicola]|nr:DUF4011 domain-containing protein [Bowdeniella nasicola]
MIDIDALPYLSLVVAHCDLRFIHRLEVGGYSRPLRSGTLRLRVTSDLGDLASLSAPLCMAAGQTARITHKPEMNRRLLHSVDEQTPATICVTVSDDSGQLLDSASAPVTVLPAWHWVAHRENRLYYELLAAYVQPNSPAVNSVLTAAADALDRTTGTSSLSPYDADDPARVDAVAEAIYTAVKERRIAYLHPEPSWYHGQRIRKPAVVLDDRLGTCLDTSLTLAAAFEQAGIDAVVWLENTHAMVGYWRTRSRMEAATLAEFHSMKNEIDLEHLVLVESTLLTGAYDTPGFRAATSRGYDRARAGEENFSAVLDIRAARLQGVSPLPAFALAPDGQSLVITHEYAAPASGPEDPAHRPTPVVDDTPDRIAQWKKALLDTSLRNRLIKFRPANAVQLGIPPAQLPAFEDLINRHKTVTLKSWDDAPAMYRAQGVTRIDQLPEDFLTTWLHDHSNVLTDLSSDAYGRKLGSLARKARLIAAESGANNLYLTFGMLRWAFKKDEIMSPLVLVPVTLRSKNRGRTFTLEANEAEQSTPNFCLLEKLKREEGLVLTALAEPLLDGAGIDLEETFRSIRDDLAKARVNYSVDPTVHLGILDFAKFRMWRDLDESWRELQRNSLVNHLVHHPTEEFTDSPEADDAEEPANRTPVDLDSLALEMPLPSDASQLEAVAAAVDGRTFVLEGPPGTGKSQTIANLLAHAMRRGKKVLFVAEKRAALEVVEQRLNDIGLADLVLELHDKRATLTSMRAQLGKAYALSNARRPTTVKTLRDRADWAVQTLTSYASAVHTPGPVGRSAYEARCEYVDGGTDSGVVAPIPPEVVKSLTPERLDAVRGLILATQSALLSCAEASRETWLPFVKAFTCADPECVLAGARELRAAVDALSQGPLSTRDLASIGTGHQLEEAMAYLDHPRVPEPNVERFRAVPPAARTAAVDFATHDGPEGPPHWRERAWTHHYRRSLLGLDLGAYAARSATADGEWWLERYFERRRIARELQEHLRDGAANPARDRMTAILTEAAQDRETLERHRRTLAAAGFEGISPQGPLSTEAHLDSQGRVCGAGPDRTPFPIAAQAAALQALAEPPFQAEVTAALDAVRRDTRRDEIRAQLIRVWDLAAQLARRVAWRSGGGAATPSAALGAVLAIRPEDLHATPAGQLGACAALVDRTAELRSLGLDELADRIEAGAIQPEALRFSCERGLDRALWEERRSQLSRFSPKDLNVRIGDYEDAIGEIRHRLPELLPIDVADRRTVNPQAKVGRAGELYKAVDSKRGRKRIRTLFSEYADLITELTPCLLMSPSSVAQFLPAKHGIFDLVIFDEASQIRVSEAIGAMGRGRSVVVVGDSKQMPPTSTFKNREGLDEDEDDEAERVIDEESILAECTASRIERRWLTWHYRSRHESLITFSNHRYYDGRLSSFPDPHPMHAPGALPEGRGEASGHRGLSFVRVRGHFVRKGIRGTRGTNPEEAEAIVEEIQRRFAEQPAPSIGVVTFNAPQRDLIEAMLLDLEDDAIAQSLESADGVFVKNLENVQGDERDTILFSIAFSKKKNGIIPNNFGLLSKRGGERRLNVAITRARSEIVMYCSFDPKELRTQESTSVGLRDLQDYLLVAQTGPNALAHMSTQRPVLDAHLDQIAEALESRGLVVTRQVGLSDFKVDIALAHRDAPERYLAAVLLDTPAWSRRKTTIDRDLLPRFVLGKLMGWPRVRRVWLPEWVEDPDAVADSIEAEVNELHRHRTAPVRPAAPVRSGEAAAAPTRAVPEPARPRRTESAPAPLERADPAGSRQGDTRWAARPPERAERDTGSRVGTEQPPPGRASRATPDGAPAAAERSAFDTHLTSPERLSEDQIALLDAAGFLPPGPEGPGEAPTAFDYQRMSRHTSIEVRQFARWPVQRQWRELRPYVEDVWTLATATQQLLPSLLEFVGPVPEEVAARIILSFVGGSRLTKSRLKDFRAALPTAVRRDPVDESLWLREWRVEAYRTVHLPPPGWVRDLDQIAVHELAYALTLSAHHLGGGTAEDLFSYTLKLYGRSALTRKARERLTRALLRAEDLHFIALQDGAFRAINR